MNSRYQIKKAFFPLLFIILGLGIIVVSRSYAVGTFMQPQGGFWPLVIGLGLTITAVLDLINELQGKNPADLKLDSFLSPLFVIIILLLWPFLLPYLGFIVVTFLVTVFLAKALGCAGWGVPLLLGIATTIATHFLFKVWFYLDLPDGVIVDWFKTVIGG